MTHPTLRPSFQSTLFQYGLGGVSDGLGNQSNRSSFEHSSNRDKSWQLKTLNDPASASIITVIAIVIVAIEAIALIAKTCCRKSRMIRI